MIENNETIKWNHFDENGNAVMVDMSQKEITERIAVASGKSGAFVNQKQNQKCTLDENPKKPAIVAVSGIKNSGKTTFLENLIQVLAGRGISTAVIKHDGHSFIIDREGTDTNRLKKAGAVGIAIFCDTQYMVVNDKTADVEELAKEFKNVDLILVEGMKLSSYPKIEIVREANSQESICPKDTMLAVATDCRKDFQVPKIALDDYEKAADLIQKCIDRIPIAKSNNNHDIGVCQEYKIFI